MNTDAYIVSAVRTAVGKAKRGSLANFRPEEMGAIAVKEAVSRVSNLAPDQIDDVLIGCAFPEGPQGMNVGRIIAQKAGLPDSVPGATINRFCSSGVQSIAMASQAIRASEATAIVAGGTESMSAVPMGGFYYSPDIEIVQDNPNTYIDMGNTAENVAEKYNVSRQDQDKFALASHQKAIDAIQSGKFKNEIVPLEWEEILYQNGKAVTVHRVFDTDECPRPDSSLEAMSSLKPVFRMGGTVTAGNASPMNDGAAATVIVNKTMLERLGVQPMAKYVSFAVAGVPPEIMGIGPVEAIPKALAKAGLTLDDIGLIELNEAFAAQALAVIRTLGLDESKINVNGGGIALGHPLGATGTKLTATLLYEMQRQQVRYGMVTMCIGGGMGAACIFENLML